MKIIELRAKNIKNLKAIQITPGDEAVILKGPNGAGKSAVLDTILIALTGKKFEQMVRNGEEKAEIEIDLGEYTVTKRIKGDRTSLEVVTKAGMIAPSPQGLLDNIIGKISFDPLSFSRMKTKDQADLLKQLVGLNFSDLDKKEKELYEKRTDTNRTMKETEARLKSLVEPEKGLPENTLSYEDQFTMLKNMRSAQDRYKDAEREKKACCDRIIEYKQDVESLTAQLEKAKKHLQDSEKIFAEYQMPTVVTDEQIAKVEDDFKKIEETNKKIVAAKNYHATKNDLKIRETSSESLTTEIEGIKTERQTRIAAANYPIEGLAVDGDVVMYKEIAFERLSTGQQIRVSAAIAMALNPQLRVIMVREGSLLDDAGLKEIEDLAKEKDYQLWIEKVEDGQPVGIHIEDGEIKNP